MKAIEGRFGAAPAARRRSTLSGQVGTASHSARQATSQSRHSPVGNLASIMAGARSAWCCACIALLTVAEAVLSGLYFDNGLDQTVIHRAMTRHERLVVEHEILELLGLGERPRRGGAPPDRAAPSFLMDVYKQLAEEHDQARPTRSSEMALTGDEQHAIDESDLIITFQAKSLYLFTYTTTHA